MLGASLGVHGVPFVPGSLCKAEPEAGEEQAGDDRDSGGPVLQVGALSSQFRPQPLLPVQPPAPEEEGLLGGMMAAAGLESHLHGLALKEGWFDYEAVANRLFEMASRQSTPSQNRKRLYKVIRK
ncbi:hypothetical protein P7K49_032476 [Saguinus oedipus]|uniref:Uncharacterized protein n=1 Tax=Saguinus oedipus TaxID=9490 RepID=A0ABQ9TYB9_SAGOE|nr:hypothetical protein P7K49_032476 [Saguinus oedipus]